ncbi:phosphatase PAP2 family protein [Streptomyces sp. NPDC017979]|uniref:phosphatase PAP2 family protein n=1 Tax=Streptomyces sp. NPDC017979 TaxID=3365024 RepID=UPI00379F62C3
MSYITARHRPRWWAELLLIAVVYCAYSAGRLVARGDVSTAVDNGLAILRAEKALYLDFETPLNDLFTEVPAIGIPADFIYASLHYLVTPIILVWLFRRRPLRYRAARAWLMISTLLGLVGFTLMPTCPPRLLDATHGFVDTMAQYSSYGWWGGEASAPRGMGNLTNQYAAMPSLHVGWSLWCGVMLWRHGRTPLLRWLGVAYPLVTTIVVMGTANHYFLDAVAGAAVMGLGLLLTRPALRVLDRIQGRAGGASVVAGGADGTPEGAEAAGEQEPKGNAEGAEGAVSGAGTPRPSREPQNSPPSDGTSPDAADDTGSPIVGAGCQTSPGERIPGQRTTAAGPSAGAGDSTPAAAR